MPSQVNCTLQPKEAPDDLLNPFGVSILCFSIIRLKAPSLPAFLTPQNSGNILTFGTDIKVATQRRRKASSDILYFSRRQSRIVLGSTSQISAKPSIPRWVRDASRLRSWRCLPGSKFNLPINSLFAAFFERTPE